MFFPDQRQQDLLEEQQTKDQIMAADNKLMNDINKFNLKYAKYVKCNVNNGSITSGCDSSDLTCCNQADSNIDPLRSLQGTINNDLNSLRKLFSRNKSSIINPDEYESEYQRIKYIEAANIRLRNELDLKLREVYNIDGPTLEDGVLPYDSSMYSAMLFTILATTGLFYAFTKI
uniref:Uncharacterized protein n=1 Tax=viral metagenome TaxID=1070528 RepID=A0A6C0JEQ5_9ZZZZ